MQEQLLPTSQTHKVMNAIRRKMFGIERDFRDMFATKCIHVSHLDLLALKRTVDYQVEV